MSHQDPSPPTPSLSPPIPSITIPTIDISPYTTPNHPDAHHPLAALAASLRAAARSPGFFQVTGHGVSPALRTRLLARLEAFFALPVGTKAALHRGRSPALRGWEAVGDQMLEPGVADRKEGFTIGAEEWGGLPDEEPGREARFLQGANQWPDEEVCPGFREVMMEYFEAVRGLSVVMFRLMALSLGLEENWFDEFVGSQDCERLDVHELPFSLFLSSSEFRRRLYTCALLSKNTAVAICRAHRYPPTTPDMAAKTRGIGAHTDFGALTLLLQDDGEPPIST